ncbi:MAG: cytochrome c [Pseudomonadota bacterium]
MKKIFALLVLAGMANVAAAADIVGNAKAAPAKVEMCIGCHGIPGYKATFPEVFQVPMIGGQSAKYIESALKAYQKGDRKHPTMRGVAASLSEQDIADVAAYYSQQSSAQK